MRTPPKLSGPKESPLASARAALLAAARHLEKPGAQSLDECARLLESAIEGISACRSMWPAENRAGFRGSRQQELDEVRRLRQGLLHVRRLLDHAAEFYQKWARRRAALSMGYTAAGEAAEIANGGRMVIRG